MKSSNRTPAKTSIELDENEARRLLEGLHEQRTELGDVAEELVRLLLDAGVTFPEENNPPDHTRDSPG
jgi:hypothetical protein